MGMLEVHDGRGRVNFVAITPDHPLLFGSDPKCDIVLHGEGVLPFHGRLRWKETKYKVEATPEAKFVELNGRKAVSASFKLGDEVRIGQCVIYLTESDEAPKTSAPTKPAAPKPTAARPAPAPAPPNPQAQARPRPQSTAKDRPRPAPAANDWAGGMEMSPPSLEVPASFEEVHELTDAETVPAEPPGAVAAKPPEKRPSRLKRMWKELLAGEQVPGQERLISPLVVLLACALVMIVALSFGLFRIIHRAQVEGQYDQAIQAFDNADWRNAAADFETFLKNNPDDHRAGKAKVLQAASRVRQYGTGPNPNWSNTLVEARKMVEETSKIPEYRDESVYLAEVVLKAAEGLADRARTTADPKILAETEEAGKLHMRIAGKPGKDLQGRSRYPEKLSLARAAVEKARLRSEALAAMDQALKNKSAGAVYLARDRLILKHPDLVKDKVVVQRLMSANDLLRLAATTDPTRRPAETAPRPEPLGPPTSLVLRTKPGDGKVAANTPIVYALAQGFAIGLDGTSGRPLWQAPVGLSSPYPPVSLRGDPPSALVFDARHNELVRFDGRTGKLLWRQGLGERVAAPPLVAGNQIVQPTPSGRLLLINVANGELQGALSLGRPLAGTPVADENGQFFYVTADAAVLFVISREPQKCLAVEYLGHTPGSIPAAPARVGRYLILPENYAPDMSRWDVFLIEEEGARLRLVQQVPLTGWLWDTPPASQSVVWAAGDRSGIAAYAMGDYSLAEPIKRIAGLTPEAETSGPAFARLKGERELWLSSGLSGKYELDVERGTIRTAWTLREAGPALAPIQATERLAILTHQYAEGPGVALWGVDPASGQPAWRTVLGVPWPVEPTPAADGQGLVALAANGRPLTLSRAQLAKGGFIEQPLPRPGTFSLPPGPLRRLEAAGATIIVPAPDAARLLVREGDGEYRPVELPAPLDAAPLVLGTDLFVPATGGRAFLIDPKTGASKAEPFLAVFDRAHPSRWKAPARLGDDAIILADDSGKLRRLTRKEPGPEESGPRLVATAEAALGKPLAADPAAVGEAVILVSTDGKVHARSARDLTPMGQTPLAAPLALGPIGAGDLVFVADATGNVLAFGPDGLKRWESDLGDDPPAGPPLIRGDTALFIDRAGTLHRLTLADGKEVGDRVPLGVPPAGPLRAAGDDTFLLVAPGTIRSLDLKSTEVARP